MEPNWDFEVLHVHKLPVFPCASVVPQAASFTTFLSPINLTLMSDVTCRRYPQLGLKNLHQKSTQPKYRMAVGGHRR
jgi:hypothetical protein